MSVNGRLAAIAGVAALLSVMPLFALTEEWAWIVPAAIGIGIVSGLGYLLRRLRIPGFLIYLAQPVALILWVGALTAGQDALLGFIPTTSWADRMVDVFSGAIDAIQTYSAPVPVGTGMTMLLVGGAGVVAWQIDTIAIAFKSAVFAGLPLAACYAITASVLLGEVDWWWFLLPAAGFLALLVSDRRTRVRSWGRSMTSSPRRSGVPQTDSLVRNGRRVGAVALLAAVGIPAMVPALSQGVLGPGGVGNGGSGENIIRTDDPLVNLKRDLNQPEGVEAFRYETDGTGSAYIRWATDAEFNGKAWRQSGQQVPNELTDDPLPNPPGLSSNIEREVVEYDITFGKAELSWLPSPYAAHRVDIEGDWRYDDETLDIVSSDGVVHVPSGFSYSVQSIEANPTYQELKNAGPYPSELKKWTQLPDFEGADIIRRKAEDIVGSARSDFEQAVRLQDHFRDDGRYEYNTEPVSERSDSPIVDFLEDRSGYCVQYAGTMAVMARMLDIPARVAVGWLPGDPEPDGKTYVVPANNAHAWPELYFEGIGWVAFEPTPSGRPGGTFEPDYTREPIDTPGGETTQQPDEPTGRETAPATPGARPPVEDSTGTGGTGPLDDPSQWPQYALGAAGMVALLCSPWAVAQLRRTVRWRTADGPREAAEAGWADLRDTVRDARLSWDDTATPRMIGHRVAGEADLADEDLEILQDVVTTTERARYAPTAGETDGLKADIADLRRTILRGRKLGVRVRAFLWPAAIRDLFALGRSRGADAMDSFDRANERLRAAIRLPRA